MSIEEQVPLAPYTTFGIGGSARFFARVKNEHEVREALAWAREKGVSFYILGGGSNVLIPDAGLDGLVIHIEEGTYSFTETTLDASAGCTLFTLIQAASKEGLIGWEKLAGIPGSVGGAVRGNAGAFGPEIKDFVTWVRAMNTSTEDVHEFSNAECAFEYRMSFFKKNPEWLILDVHLTLGLGDALASRALIDETIFERERRHIQNVKAAGSFFMNPVAPLHVVSQFELEKGVESRGGRVPAGWLIEKVGMKGERVGGAQVSPQQANYIVNANNASSADVQVLAAKVKEAVLQKFGVTLIEEAVIVLN